MTPLAIASKILFLGLLSLPAIPIGRKKKLVFFSFRYVNVFNQLTVCSHQPGSCLAFLGQFAVFFLSCDVLFGC